MKILVIGGGGREHALAWKLAQSPLVDALFCLPGNGGIAAVATCIPGNVDDIDAILAICRDKEIDFVVVGPEGPLVEGLVDRLEAEGIKAFGPRANAAILEQSKGFTKDFCARHNIPTAAYGRFTQAAPAKDFLLEGTIPVVIKADGLAAGKGVIIAQSMAEAEEAVDDILGGRFGNAGNEIVIEEFMAGEEASFFALIDGKTALPLAGAQDHKRVGDGDTGPNTGGMGAYSPAPILDAAMASQVMTEIVQPTVDGLAAEGRAYQGVLYAGLMIENGKARLVEYNVRFGDPECQVLMIRLKSDILPALIATADRTLGDVELDWHDDVALTVVMAAKGYPESYAKGTEIKSVDAANTDADVTVFHAGTKLDDGKLVNSGGRVLNITALGASVTEAQSKAYSAIAKIDWPEGFYRRDIGWRAAK